MINFMRHAYSCPVTVMTGILAASAGALFVALYSQFALHLDPCKLCMYQRMPYIAAVLLSVIGFVTLKNPKAVKIITLLCAIAFLIDAGVAMYHTGVERKWWDSAVEGCAVPDFSKSPNILEQILTAPVASCHDIAWADPLLGLTMANYNVVYALALFIGCLLALGAKPHPGPSERP